VARDEHACARHGGDVRCEWRARRGRVRPHAQAQVAGHVLQRLQQLRAVGHLAAAGGERPRGSAWLQAVLFQDASAAAYQDASDAAIRDTSNAASSEHSAAEHACTTIFWREFGTWMSGAAQRATTSLEHRTAV